MSETVIHVDGLGKRYRLGRAARYRTLRESVMDTVKAPARRLRGLVHRVHRTAIGGPAAAAGGSGGADANGAASGGRADDTLWALRDVNFDGIVILDHTPSLTGGHYAEQAYGFAYMKALFNRANAEARQA